MLSSGPIREICGTAYAEESCSDPGWSQTPEKSDLQGTILSRLLQILINIDKIDSRVTDDSFEEPFGERDHFLIT